MGEQVNKFEDGNVNNIFCFFNPESLFALFINLTILLELDQLCVTAKTVAVPTYNNSEEKTWSSNILVSRSVPSAYLVGSFVDLSVNCCCSWCHYN